MKKKLIIIISLALIVIAAGVVILLNVLSKKKIDGYVENYKSFITNGDYDSAINYYKGKIDEKKFIERADEYTMEVYNNSISGEDKTAAYNVYNKLLADDKKATLTAEHKNAIEAKKQAYTNKEITDEEAISQMEIYNGFENDETKAMITDNISYVKKISVSRKAYEDATAKLEKKDYAGALGLLANVIPEDDNYSAAEKMKNDIYPEYKSKVQEGVKSNIEKNSYAAAQSLVDGFLKYYTDDDIKKLSSDIQTKKAAYEAEQKRIKEEEEKKKKEEAEKNQEVEVASARVKDYGYWLVSMGVDCTLKNNSNKTVVEAKVYFLLYTSTGKPATMGGVTNALTGTYDDCKIKPGAKYTPNYYFTGAPDNAKKVRACVRSVTYSDGTTWTNPYYNYWRDEYESSYDGK